MRNCFSECESGLPCDEVKNAFNKAWESLFVFCLWVLTRNIFYAIMRSQIQMFEGDWFIENIDGGVCFVGGWHFGCLLVKNCQSAIYGKTSKPYSDELRSRL